MPQIISTLVHMNIDHLIWLYSDKFYVLKAMFVPWVYSFSLVQLNHPRDSLLFHIKGHWMEQGKMKERCDKIIEHISVFCPLQILSQFGSYFLVFLPISWDFIRNGSYVSILKVNEIPQYQICVLYEWLITNINIF